MKKENEFFKPKISYRERYQQETLLHEVRKDEVLSILLDSNLIFQTNKKFTNIKIIDCGDYKQVYSYKNLNYKKDNELCKFKDMNKMCAYLSNKVGESKKSSSSELKEIELKNLNRSKFELQRLVKTNEKEFKTFVTLTFADNVNDITEANKKFNSWRTYIKKLKNDFKCIGVPEFQKRGAVHYHLLTNINYNDTTLLSQEEVKLWNKDTKQWQIGKNIVGWNKGYSLVKDMNSINVIGYLTKYMTKDIDNRLWGHRRYFYTHNLKKPVKYEFNINDIKDLFNFTYLLDNCNMTYSKSYSDDYRKNDINYFEFKKVL